MEKKYYFRGLGLGIIVTAVIMGIALSGGTRKREMTDEEVIARAKELGMTEDTRLLEPSGEEGETEPTEDDTAAVQTPVKKDVAVKTEAELEKQEAEEGDSSGTEEAAGTEQKPTVDTPEPVQTTTSASTTETKPAQATTSAASTAVRPRADTNEMNKQDDDREPAQSKTEENDGEKPTGGTTSAGNSTANSSSGGMKSVTIVGGDSSYTIAKKLEAAGVVSSASSYDTYLCENGYDKKLRTGTFQIPAGATEEQIAKIVTGQ